MRRQVVWPLWLAAVLWLTPGVAQAHPDGVDLPATTPSYLVTLRLGPPGRTIAVDQPVQLPDGAGEVVLCTTDQRDLATDAQAQDTHHLEVHVLDRRTWAVLDEAKMAIMLRNTMTGLPAVLPPVRMVDPDKGLRDVHWGGEVLTPPGRYRVEVIVNGEPAAFEFVSRGGQIEPPPDPVTVLVGRGPAPALLILLGVVALVVFVQALVGNLQPADAARARVLFLAVVLFQGVHELEHVVQVVQAFVFNVRGAAGLLGSVFGLEPVHFAYNALFLTLVGVAFASFGVRRRVGVARPVGVAVLLGFALGLQSYHVVEHLAKIEQYLSSGVNGVPGLLGAYFNPIWLHFWLNTVAYVPCVAAFFVGAVHREVGADLRGLRGRGRRASTAATVAR
jgi:hypothetical protein